MSAIICIYIFISTFSEKRSCIFYPPILQVVETPTPTAKFGGKASFGLFEKDSIYRNPYEKAPLRKGGSHSLLRMTEGLFIYYLPCIYPSPCYADSDHSEEKKICEIF